MLISIEDAFRTVEYDIQGADDDDTETEHPQPPRVGDDIAIPGMAVEAAESAPVVEPVDRQITIDFQGTSWDVDLRLVVDEAVSRWLTVAKRDHRAIALTVNQSHPFMRAWCELPGQELEPVWRVAVALGLAQMARLGGAKMPGLVTENVNALLRNVLSHKS